MIEMGFCRERNSITLEMIMPYYCLIIPPWSSTHLIYTCKEDISSRFPRRCALLLLSCYYTCFCYIMCDDKREKRNALVQYFGRRERKTDSLGSHHGKDKIVDPSEKTEVGKQGEIHFKKWRDREKVCRKSLKCHGCFFIFSKCYKVSIVSPINLQDFVICQTKVYFISPNILTMIYEVFDYYKCDPDQ